jgi:hypothetical protein
MILDRVILCLHPCSKIIAARAHLLSPRNTQPVPIFPGNA